MSYVMAVVIELKDGNPIEAQEELIKTLPENTLYITNPLAMEDGPNNQFDVDVFVYDEQGQRNRLRSMIEIESYGLKYPEGSNAYIARSLGLSEALVNQILEDSR